MRGLRRRDLDLTEGVVRVRQAVTRTKGQVHVGAPKTAAGTRDVGIPPHLIPYLAKYVAALPVTGRDGFLFPGGGGVSPGPGGEAITFICASTSESTRWQKLIRDLNISLD